MIRRRAAGDDNAHFVTSAGHQLLYLFAYSLSFRFVGHFIQPVEKQNDLIAAIEQLGEEIFR